MTFWSIAWRCIVWRSSSIFVLRHFGTFHFRRICRGPLFYISFRTFWSVFLTPWAERQTLISILRYTSPCIWHMALNMSYINIVLRNCCRLFVSICSSTTFGFNYRRLYRLTTRRYKLRFSSFLLYNFLPSLMFFGFSFTLPWFWVFFDPSVLPRFLYLFSSFFSFACRHSVSSVTMMRSVS